MKPEKSNRAIIYTGVWSGEENPPTLDEQSVDAQTYCLLEGLDVVEIIADSGPYVEGRLRSGFEQLLEKVISQDIHHIVLRDLSRVCRKPKEAVSLLSEAFHPDSVEIHVLSWGLTTSSPEGRRLLSCLREVWELELKGAQWERASSAERLRLKPLWHRLYGLLQDERYAEVLIMAIFDSKDQISLSDKENAAVHGGYDHLTLFKALGFRIKAERTDNTKLVADVLTRHWDRIKVQLQSELTRIIEGSGTEAVF